jgi:hypothetical protein
VMKIRGRLFPYVIITGKSAIFNHIHDLSVSIPRDAPVFTRDVRIFTIKSFTIKVFIVKVFAFRVIVSVAKNVIFCEQYARGISLRSRGESIYVTRVSELSRNTLIVTIIVTIRVFSFQVLTFRVFAKNIIIGE